MDAEDNGFAAGLSNCVTRDGQGQMGADFVPSVGNTFNLGTAARPWASINGLPISSIISGIYYKQTGAEAAASVTPTNYFVPPGQIDRYFNNVTPGTTDATAAFASAIAQNQQAGGAPITVNSLLAIASNVTIPAATVVGGADTVPTAVLQVISGSINIAAGMTLSINGTFICPRITCFLGTGVVIFADGSITEAYLEWWGARPDSLPGGAGTIVTAGTDCTAAIAAALLACSGGAGVLVGLVPIKLAAGYYMTGPQTLPPATRFVGAGRIMCGFLAKAGTTGVWFTDTGNAAKICLEDITWWGAYAAAPGITTLLQLGYNATQFGSAGYIQRCMFRDGACASSGWHLDVNQNVAYFHTLEIQMSNQAGQSGFRLTGAFGRAYDITCVGPGNGGTGINVLAIGSLLDGLEIEAPASGSTPLSLGANCTVVNPVFSSANYAAAGGALANWVTFSANASNWALIGVNYAFTSAGVNSGTDTVTNGNFLRSDGSYFGGNATAVTAYNAGTTYQPGNIATNGGVTYICTATSTGHAPPNASFWAVTTLGGYGHGGEGNYFSDNYGQTDQAFTLRLVNTAGTLQHRFADPGGNAINTNLIGTINAATPALTNTPTGTDATTAFAAGAKISTAQTNTIILDTPGWPASAGAATQRVSDFDAVATIMFNSTGTALTVIASVQSFNVNGITRSRWSLGFYNASSGAAFALTTANIPAGDLIQVNFRGGIAR